MLAAGRIQWLGSAAAAGWQPDSWLRLWARHGSPLPLGHIDVRMSDNAWDSVRKKVRAIFTELAGDRARMLEGDTFPAGITSTITAALSGSGASEEQVLHADQIAFHLTDWSSDGTLETIQMELARRSDPGEENGRRFDARRAGGLDFRRGSRGWRALSAEAWTRANCLVINGWKGG